MAKIVVFTNITLDGVMQAPGRPEEDTRGGFQFGGWGAPYAAMASSVATENMPKIGALLLGRRTYDIFAGYWPQHSGDPVSDNFNRTTKYVVSRQKRDLSWQHSILITGDVVAELKRLKQQDGNDLWVHGSGNFIQTLLKHDLVDEFWLKIFPITLGSGKRLFGEGTQPASLRLIDSKISTTGIIIATYIPAGELKTGSFALE